MLLLLLLVLGPHLSSEKLEDYCGPQFEDTPKGGRRQTYMPKIKMEEAYC